MDEENKNTDEFADEIDYKSEYEKAKQQLSDKDSEIAKITLDSKVTAALSSCQLQDIDIAKLLIDYSKIKQENGQVTGLKEQIEALRKSKPFLFADESAKPRIKAGSEIKHQSGGGEKDMDRIFRRSSNV
ncbi:hypothetical protein AGMMS49975_22850 [Clostridia bacterium]|nr:hypothetical protein AGMMS49975_22850 [Clostridia bacterium]